MVTKNTTEPQHTVSDALAQHLAHSEEAPEKVFARLLTDAAAQDQSVAEFLTTLLNPNLDPANPEPSTEGAHPHFCDGKWRWYCCACSGLPNPGCPECEKAEPQTPPPAEREGTEIPPRATIAQTLYITYREHVTDNRQAIELAETATDNLLALLKKRK